MRSQGAEKDKPFIQFSFLSNVRCLFNAQTGSVKGGEVRAVYQPLTGSGWVLPLHLLGRKITPWLITI